MDEWYQRADNEMWKISHTYSVYCLTCKLSCMKLFLLLSSSWVRFMKLINTKAISVCLLIGAHEWVICEGILMYATMIKSAQYSISPVQIKVKMHLNNVNLVYFTQGKIH